MEPKMHPEPAARQGVICRGPNVPGLLCALLAMLALAWHPAQRAAAAEPSIQSACTQPVSIPAPPAVDDEMAQGPPPDSRSGLSEEPSVHGPRPGGRQGDELSWKVLSEFYPEQARRLRQLRERNPKEFARVEGQMRPWLHELREARARNPELARILVKRHQTEMAIHDWQRRYRQAPADQREGLMADGRQLIEQRVELRLQEHRLEVQMLEKRLQMLKTKLQERESQKEAVVDRELSRLTNPPTSQPAKGRQADGEKGKQGATAEDDKVTK